MDKKPLITDFRILERILKPKEVRNIYYFKPIKGFSMDSRSIKKQQAYIAIKGKHHDGNKFIKSAVLKGANFVIAQNYIPTKPRVPFYIVDDTCQALAAIANYIREKKKPFVYGITGSIGKTTTKEMLSFLLEPYFKVLKNKKTENNLLGVGKTILCLQDEKVMILELGTNMKGEIRELAQISRPDIGIITFIKPVHLEGLGSLKGILKEKTSLLEGNPKIKAVLNSDDPYLAKVKNQNKIYWFGSNKGSNLWARLVKRADSNSLFLIQNKYKLTLPFHYEEFITNSLAAILGAHLLGIPLADLVGRMSSFCNWPAMRMQMQELNGFFILNDAYNANPYSLTKALESLRNYSFKKIAVIGDMLELGKKSIYYHKLLASSIIKNNIDYCLTIGDHTVHLSNRLKELGYPGAFHFSSHSSIARFISKKAERENPLKRYLIFLKGSRKMELEKVIDYLRPKT
jgi:UDP-N-acetylmuramoyl-tripeptide--D-alanyl-D-alanine ligase